jgi:hypothetical protein
VPAQEDPLQKVIARCWDDQAFKERLVADPAATLAAEGVEVPEGVTVRVVVESATERALVVPCAPSRGLPDESLEQVVGGQDWWCDSGLCDEPIEN